MQFLNKYKRYQEDIDLIDYVPDIPGYCACGCGKKLTGRQKRWASSSCSEKAYAEFAILKGNTTAIRDALFEIDKGFCRLCGAYHEKWEADHIIPVVKGGGGCDITNFQTLCPSCHKAKTYHQRYSQRSAISSQDASNKFKVLLKAEGAIE